MSAIGHTWVALSGMAVPRTSDRRARCKHSNDGNRVSSSQVVVDATEGQIVWNAVSLTCPAPEPSSSQMTLMRLRSESNENSNTRLSCRDKTRRKDET